MKTLFGSSARMNNKDYIKNTLWKKLWQLRSIIKNVLISTSLAFKWLNEQHEISVRYIYFDENMMTTLLFQQPAYKTQLKLMHHEDFPFFHSYAKKQLTRC